MQEEIVFLRGEQLWLPEDKLEEICRQKVSDRVKEAKLVIWLNGRAISDLAASRGGVDAFNTFTLTEADDYDEASRSWSLFLKRVRKRIPELCGQRVFEWGRRGTKRLHFHTQWYPLIEAEDLKQYMSGTVVSKTQLRVKPIDRDGLGRYLDKELGKQRGRRGLGRRLYATFGDFPNRVRLDDVRIESPLRECKRLAWAQRQRHERYLKSTYAKTWEFAADLERMYFEGKLKLGPPWDDGAQDHGDAWEGEGGEMDFDPSKFES